MKPVALMTFQNEKVHVEITDQALGEAIEVVYAWTTAAGEWVRVGTSSGPLKKRLFSYAQHITKALEGKKSQTPEWEALRWRELIQKEGQLIALAHQPQHIETIAGNLRPFLDIERVLIREKKPNLNRSHR